MSRTLRGVIASLAVALSLTACGGGGGDDPLAGDKGGGGTVTVGSANFAESSLLAEIYAQALEAKGIKVTRKFDIGAREVYYDQVVKGGLSVVPEYNGALLATSVDKNSKATTSEQINAELKAKLPQQVEILNSSAAEDKDSITITKATSQKHGNLTSLDQLKNYAGQMTLAAGSEFKTRQQGVVGLESVYGVKFKKVQSVDAGAQSTLVKLLKDDSIQAANLYTTDPAIAAEGFVVLQDPKNLFASQNVTPLIYKSAVNATGREALNAISAKLTTQDLLDMMKRISIDKADQETVAKDWLKKAALVS
ncbi:ABC transporter substrate-binding protein [Spirillospora sp. CA-255316]